MWWDYRYAESGNAIYFDRQPLATERAHFYGDLAKLDDSAKESVREEGADVHTRKCCGHVTR